jgi:diguanylate cyclase (GGDEF)-like protein
MPRRLIYPKEVTDQEARRLAEPAALATMILCGLLIVVGVQSILTDKPYYLPLILGAMGIVYALILFYVIMPSPKRLQLYKWPVIFLQAIAVSSGIWLLTGDLRIIPLLIMVLISIIMLMIWDRGAAYAFILLAGGAYLAITIWVNSLAEIIYQAGFFLMAVIAVESIERLYASNQKRVLRLQAINEFARRVSVLLDVPEVIDLIGTAIKDALQADTYFFGLLEEDQLKMQLIFDEGEFYPPESVPLEGSLSGWVIRNQESLFIADLRNDVDLEGVKMVLVGQNKTSLCWMGVPLHAMHVEGIIAVASYKPNDFNRTDLELLENLAQQAALVLDNAYHHAEVEAQSHLDSLTGVYNHGYIVKILNDEAQNCLAKNAPLSLIMLDIDYFKQYNDNYGHVVGDQVLQVLTQAIRQHIKSSDSIGRWGGEEFTIVLPGTSGLNAQLVAGRVQETVSSLTLTDRDGNHLPFPTVSQGLAIFPSEANDVSKLIDLSDRRLYTAKNRGRNQIEPKMGSWELVN